MRRGVGYLLVPHSSWPPTGTANVPAAQQLDKLLLKLRRERVQELGRVLHEQLDLAHVAFRHQVTLRSPQRRHEV